MSVAILKAVALARIPASRGAESRRRVWGGKGARKGRSVGHLGVPPGGWHGEVPA
jgi:hypothetical protein